MIFDAIGKDIVRIISKNTNWNTFQSKNSPTWNPDDGTTNKTMSEYVGKQFELEQKRGMNQLNKIKK